MFSPRTTRGPLTACFQTPVCTVPPRHSTSFGRPTFTETSVAIRTYSLPGYHAMQGHASRSTTSSALRPPPPCAIACQVRLRVRVVPAPARCPDVLVAKLVEREVVRRDRGGLGRRADRPDCRHDEVLPHDEPGRPHADLRADRRDRHDHSQDDGRARAQEGVLLGGGLEALEHDQPYPSLSNALPTDNARVPAGSAVRPALLGVATAARAWRTGLRRARAPARRAPGRRTVARPGVWLARGDDRMQRAHHHVDPRGARARAPSRLARHGRVPPHPAALRCALLRGLRFVRRAARVPPPRHTVAHPPPAGGLGRV